MSRTYRLSYAALAIGLIAFGCAEERPPRSFVQPNVIKKSDLAGVWHYLSTTTDAPPTNSAFAIGWYGEMQKVKFDVQENYIYARRAYEYLVGSEDAAAANPEGYIGQPVAVWRISSQFDIIREYNATTGEETNRIIESTERPWNEREFIRVDWSQNVVKDVIGLGLWVMLEDGAVDIQPVSYWESDPTKPDALHFERADERDTEFTKGEANYFDITNKWVVTPTERTECYEGPGGQECIKFPACFFYYDIEDCASQVVKIRHSFSKVSPTHQYEPREWDGKQMDLFGIFDNRRLSYNRQYGITNSGFIRRAQRFNLWKKSYGEDGKTPLPFNQREQRTIPYYAMSSTGTFPPELFDTGREVIRQWNEAFKTAVTSLKGSPADKDVFVWCHNPVKLREDTLGPADDAACVDNLKPELASDGKVKKDENGDPIYHARYGDPRRSNITWISQWQAGGPLGLGPGHSDPETGETTAGYSNIYGGALDTYAARSRDLVLLAAGRLQETDYIEGANVKRWVEQNRGGTMAKEARAPEEVVQAARSMDFSWAKGAAPEAPLDTSSTKSFFESLKRRDDAMYRGGLFGNNNADLKQIQLNKLKGSTIEAKMITPDIMAMSGTGAGTDWTALSDAEKSRISPLRSHALRKAVRDRQNKLMSYGFDFADFADEGITQRALKLATDPNITNMDPEAIRQQLRKDIFLAVTLHEMGHNVGLRHNFRATYDSMNYFPQYWQLRSAGAKAAMNQKYLGVDSQGRPIAGNYAGGANCTQNAGKLRPRYIDCPGGAISVGEVMGGAREYMYSSVMDYGAEFNSDFYGLGKYDKAAIKFSYTNLVEVFTDAKTDPVATASWEGISYFQGSFGFPAPLTIKGFVENNLKSVNYTSYPTLFETGIDGFEKRADVPFSEIAEGGGEYQAMKTDAMGRVMVPYYFCGDEFVGNLTCQRYDSGADPYEQASDLISRYQNFYVMNNFKRDRYQFQTSGGYWDRISGRYLDILREQLTWYTLLRSEFTDLIPSANTFYASEEEWGPFTLAVTDGFDLLGRIITMPTVGGYVKVPAAQSSDYPIDYWKNQGDSTSAAAYTGNVKIVDLLDGKYVETTWDFDACGYYWANECQTRIGYFIDKTIALDILSQSQAYFTGRDTSTDVRKYAIGYILPFKHQVQEKIGALLAGDYQSLAPSLGANDKIVAPKWTVNDDFRDPVTRQPIAREILDPSTGFTTQLYAGVYGLAGFPSTFDREFIETTKIFVVGNGEAPVSDTELLANVGTTGIASKDPADLIANGGNKKWLLWTNDITGKTYAALSVPRTTDGDVGGTGKLYRQDTAVRMLETAKKLADNVRLDPTNVTKQNAVNLYIQNVEIMRGLHSEYGYGFYK